MVPMIFFGLRLGLIFSSLQDLEGLEPLEICIAVDHHILPPTSRRQFFTFQSPNSDWKLCGYHGCPKPGGHHDVGQGSGYQILDPGARIELSDKVQCGCVYLQNPRGEVMTLLIGMEYHRPWVHLTRNVNTSRVRRQIITDADLVSSPITTQSNYQAYARSTPAPSHSRSMPLPRTSTRPQSRKYSLMPLTEVCEGEIGCPVCGYTFNIGGIKHDFVIGKVFDEEIEVDIQKRQACTSEVDYVITVAAT
ncbi:hypothetical protein EDB19DRAFT_1094897 [Suillus lakei]|nr:hypothetical protein EDB19DRAFT_1094897 [Suillus lakei]